MGKNLVRQTFLNNTNWICPGGVTSVRMLSYKFLNWSINNAQGMIAMDTSGNGWAWGSNAFGEVGVGDVVPRSSPVLVLESLQFKQVAHGDAHSLGLTVSGELYAWGNNAYGQLGDNTQTNRSSPVLVQGGTKFVSVHAGTEISFAIDQNQNLYSWGANFDLNVNKGRLGLGNATAAVSTPTLVSGSIKWKSVSVGQVAVIGIDINGQIYSWGAGTSGVLGNGNAVSGSYAVSAPTLLGSSFKFRKVASGLYTAYGITEQGATYAWGSNNIGQLGNNSLTDTSNPTLVNGSHSFKSIQAGSTWALAMDDSGAAWGWGANSAGSLADGTLLNRSTPVAVVGGVTFRQIFAGNASGWGVDVNDNMWGWGYNTYGEVGDGTVVQRSSPVAVLGGLKFQCQEIFSEETILTTVPGTTYAINFTNGVLTFGGVIVDYECPKAILEFMA